jgi:hypothetical protein
MDGHHDSGLTAGSHIYYYSIAGKVESIRPVMHGVQDWEGHGRRGTGTAVGSVGPHNREAQVGAQNDVRGCRRPLELSRSTVSL